jgi:DNA-binding CsgD family transcriptional regulator
VVDHPDEWLPRALENEFYEEDFSKFSRLAVSRNPVGILGRLTGGEPSRSIRYREILMPMRMEAELRAALVVDNACWGYLALQRERGREDFNLDESRLLLDVGPVLAQSLRRSILVAGDPLGDVEDAPGLLLLDEHFSLETMTPPAVRWLEELSAGRSSIRPLPDPVYAVAIAARSLSEGHVPPGTPYGIARLRVPTRSGRWLILHGSRLGPIGGSGCRSSVIIEPARPNEVASLIFSAYGLSRRERQVAELVLTGASTSKIASSLYISSHTVQEHLKAIFTKTGVRSRRELVGEVSCAITCPALWEQAARRLLTSRPASRLEDVRPEPDVLVTYDANADLTGGLLGSR